MKYFCYEYNFVASKKINSYLIVPRYCWTYRFQSRNDTVFVSFQMFFKENIQICHCARARNDNILCLFCLCHIPSLLHERQKLTVSKHNGNTNSSITISAANRLIGEVVQSRRRPLLGPSLWLYNRLWNRWSTTQHYSLALLWCYYLCFHYV